MSAPRGSLRKKTEAARREGPGRLHLHRDPPAPPRRHPRRPQAWRARRLRRARPSTTPASLDPFELKVAAATWLIALSGGTRRRRSLGEVPPDRRARPPRRLRAPPHRRELRRRGHPPSPRRLRPSRQRALEEADVKLSAEAGFPIPALRRPAGSRSTSAPRPAITRRPRRAPRRGQLPPRRGDGRSDGPRARGEKGFRVRLPSGAEMMLVRERLGQWFADEHVE
jgi:hypothetical protein